MYCLCSLIRRHVYFVCMCVVLAPDSAISLKVAKELELSVFGDFQSTVLIIQIEAQIALSLASRSPYSHLGAFLLSGVTRCTSLSSSSVSYEECCKYSTLWSL